MIMPTSTTRDISGRTFISVCIVALAVGAGLRFFRLGHRSLWEDELSTWTSIRSTVMDGIRYVQMPHPPLYSLSARAVAGDPVPSEATLRLPAAVYGIAAIAAAGWLAVCLYGRAVAAAVLMAMALNAFQIKYSQEARMYSLLTLTTTLSVLFWHRLVAGGRRRDYVGYLMSTVCLLYSHYLAALVLAAQGTWLTVYIAARRDGWRATVKPILAMAAPLVAFAPLGVFFVLEIMPNRIAWIQHEPIGAYVTALGRMVAGPIDRIDAGDFVDTAPIAGVVVFILAMVGLCAPPRSVKGERNTPTVRQWLVNRQAELLLALWAAFTLGGLFVLSELVHPTFVPRYAISTAVPVAILVLVGAARFGRWLLWAATVFLCLNGVLDAVDRLTTPAGPDGLRSIIEHLNNHADANDAAVVVDLPFCPDWKNPVVMGFDYYGLRPDIEVLHIQGDLATNVITSDEALADPRNLHIIVLRGDVETALDRRGRSRNRYIAEPYRYYQVRGTDVEHPPIAPD